MEQSGGGAGALPPSGPRPGPIIVTALLGDADFAWADGLRRAHFPAERNRVAAHLTLFHHLAPSLGDELARRLVAETRQEPPPPARIAGVMRLAQGTAFRVDSAELEVIRAEARALLAEYQRYVAYSNAQAAWGRVYNSVGLDVLPKTIASHDVKALAKAIETTTSEWQGQVFTVGAR